MAEEHRLYRNRIYGKICIGIGSQDGFSDIYSKYATFVLPVCVMRTFSVDPSTVKVSSGTKYTCKPFGFRLTSLVSVLRSMRSSQHPAEHPAERSSQVRSRSPPRGRAPHVMERDGAEHTDSRL